MKEQKAEEEKQNVYKLDNRRKILLKQKNILEKL